MRTVATAVLVTALTASAALAPAAEKAAAKPAAKPQTFVAKVNGVGITETEFTRNWEYFLQRSGIPANHADKSGKVEEFRKQVLDRLVDEELLYQEAKSRKVLATKEQVDAEMEKARKKLPTPEAFAEALERNKLSEEGLRTVFARNLSIESLVEKEIAKGLTVSDAEVHDFYTGNKEKFETPDQVRARHILVKVDQTADEKTREAARTKADDLLAQLKGGADFQELAKKSSDCPSAPQGGDLGLIRRGQMVPAFDQAAFALQQGELSGVVQSEFGYHIIKVDEKKPAGMVPESEAAAKIREYLLSQKTEAAVEKRLKSLREQAKIELLMKP